MTTDHPPATPHPISILLLDSYDSYTFNLHALLRSLFPHTDIHVLHNDSISPSELRKFLPTFDFVVVGPGPGHPGVKGDIGIIPEVWGFGGRQGEVPVPVLGVCLGMQSLCLHFGGAVMRLHTPKHGQISRLEYPPATTTTSLLFTPHTSPPNVVRYHSLHAILPHPPSSIPLTPLAYTSDPENGRVLMAVAHHSLPFYAVQYHPESISSEGGASLISNFWDLARGWNTDTGRDAGVKSVVIEAKTEVKPRPLLLSSSPPPAPRRVTVRKLQTHICPLSLIPILGIDTAAPYTALLESLATPGRWSILAVPSSRMEHITYRIPPPSPAVPDTVQEVQVDDGVEGVHKYLAHLMQARKPDLTQGYEEVPFCGGLVGYMTYEMGVAGLGIDLLRSEKAEAPAGGGGADDAPDVNMLFVERSVVVDTLTNTVYIQSLCEDDAGWVDDVAAKIIQAQSQPPPSSPTVPKLGRRVEVKTPNKAKYEADVRTAQEFLAAGESYELCLTAQTSLRTSTPAWSLYQRLRQTNPAPYAAYLKLGEVTVLSSSPERAVSWTRPRDGQRSVVELRPIKGTVRKSSSVETIEDAQIVLRNPKDLAENLMIVDLIRHDLTLVSAPSTVHVPHLMRVEEYSHLFQLVSVVRGELDGDSGYVGWDALRGMVPAGSMTGAPKKRSVEILRELEGEGKGRKGERGVYSGVMGYWSVCGAGDWSVVIRTAVNYGNRRVRPEDEDEGDVWWIGAGGAVTALSTPEGEEEEMRVKLGSVLRGIVGDGCM
ncbi:para-aminobenzoate synthase [Saitoella complicata NRRL Y-17804]|uniref:para-aminobenzoate synthase n=1 Tax=Saitoella complicata (strain BCRC 22490 / CBS 7301 / JCM 7358 / NBRC 10748 / NRRL Y-17804) TaxID=698492 RepID=UPI00086770B7|nr:para-aminobenzoate synthase [Saitoella complicata NRRL Y-17804]ODQ54882.1 para-aminobenzoate synthase [Saitoella complicata NRRL Y-17804]